MDAIYYVIIAIILIVAAIVGWYLVRSGIIFKPPQPPSLPGKWQFFTSPTTLLPPGTIFRIGKENRMQIVGDLQVPIQKGATAPGRLDMNAEASMGVMARFLELKELGLDVSANKTTKLQYEIKNALLEITSDTDVDPALKKFMSDHPDLEIREDEKYFIIRQAQEADEIDYQLTQDLVEKVGGEVTIDKIVESNANVISSKQHGVITIQQSLVPPMRVTFLPDQISLVKARGVAGEPPIVKRKPFTGVLELEE